MERVELAPSLTSEAESIVRWYCTVTLRHLDKADTISVLQSGRMRRPHVQLCQWAPEHRYDTSL